MKKIITFLVAIAAIQSAQADQEKLFKIDTSDQCKPEIAYHDSDLDYEPTQSFKEDLSAYEQKLDDVKGEPEHFLVNTTWGIPVRVVSGAAAMADQYVDGVAKIGKHILDTGVCMDGAKNPGQGVACFIQTGRRVYTVFTRTPIRGSEEFAYGVYNAGDKALGAAQQLSEKIADAIKASGYKGPEAPFVLAGLVLEGGRYVWRVWVYAPTKAVMDAVVDAIDTISCDMSDVIEAVANLNAPQAVWETADWVIDGAGAIINVGLTAATFGNCQFDYLDSSCHFPELPYAKGAAVSSSWSGTLEEEGLISNQK